MLNGSPWNMRNMSDMAHARPVLTIKTVWHGRELWKLSRSCKLCVYYARQTREIVQALSYSVDFKALGDLFNTLSKTSKCSYIQNKGTVNIWNRRKTKRKLYVGPVNIFPNFDTAGLFHAWLFHAPLNYVVPPLSTEKLAYNTKLWIKGPWCSFSHKT